MDEEEVYGEYIIPGDETDMGGWNVGEWLKLGRVLQCLLWTKVLHQSIDPIPAVPFYTNKPVVVVVEPSQNSSFSVFICIGLKRSWCMFRKRQEVSALNFDPKMAYCEIF